MREIVTHRNSQQECRFQARNQTARPNRRFAAFILGARSRSPYHAMFWGFPASKIGTKSSCAIESIVWPDLAKRR